MAAKLINAALYPLFRAYDSYLQNRRQKKLKEDEDGKKVTDVRGIRAACKVMKTRYAKPFESVQVKIPYETGMDPYSGLVDLFEKKGLLKQQGNRLKYVDSSKREHLEYRKDWSGEKLEIIMHDFDNLEQKDVVGDDDTEE